MKWVGGKIGLLKSFRGWKSRVCLGTVFKRIQRKSEEKESEMTSWWFLTGWNVREDVVTSNNVTATHKYT